MSKPFIHAKSSARKFGGTPEIYLPLHDFMDNTKGSIASPVHRALTHNAWFISNVIEKVFGYTIKNSNGREISTREIAEQHILEDFKGKFIPTAQDYLQYMEIKPWMINGQGYPPSCEQIGIAEKEKRKNVSRRIVSGEVESGSGEPGAIGDVGSFDPLLVD